MFIRPARDIGEVPKPPQNKYVMASFCDINCRWQEKGFCFDSVDWKGMEGISL